MASNHGGLRGRIGKSHWKWNHAKTSMAMEAFASDKIHTDFLSGARDACYKVGPLVEILTAGERVYYFPQGHMEQLQASTNQELSESIPRFNPSSKIL